MVWPPAEVSSASAVTRRLLTAASWPATTAGPVHVDPVDLLKLDGGDEHVDLVLAGSELGAGGDPRAGSHGTNSRSAATTGGARRPGERARDRWLVVAGRELSVDLVVVAVGELAAGDRGSARRAGGVAGGGASGRAGVRVDFGGTRSRSAAVSCASP